MGHFLRKPISVWWIKLVLKWDLLLKTNDKTADSIYRDIEMTFWNVSNNSKELEDFMFPAIHTKMRNSVCLVK